MRTTTLLAHLGTLTTVLAASIQQPIFSAESQTSFGGKDDKFHIRGKWDNSEALHTMMDAISVMQDKFYNIAAGKWPDAIDWTAAVTGTHVSATLSSMITGIKSGKVKNGRTKCIDLMGWENVISKFFTHTTIFYYNEDALSLRGQAYDDMLWVVLGWLENVKFANLYSDQHPVTTQIDGAEWHGTQVSQLAAHRARIFYELAETGWDTTACGGGMTWNPTLEPYKNAITNELFAAASIAMYLYFPGDNNSFPFMATDTSYKPHNPKHLENAIQAYKWLTESNMTNSAGLYEDGYHITGWKKYDNGTIDHGTGNCDSINTMVYTYNQGVLLSANRGLWMATGLTGYLNEGHQLIENVIKATGFPDTDSSWAGLGRGGVLEDDCDCSTNCSQDAQTFKGIFFHHMTEFCRPLWPSEEQFLMSAEARYEYYEPSYWKHMWQCEQYGDWIERNARAAEMTKTDEGQFGMWWGVFGSSDEDSSNIRTEGSQQLPEGAVDYRNPPLAAEYTFTSTDPNENGRGRTVETQAGGLAVLRARWQWRTVFGSTGRGLPPSYR